MIRNLQKNVLGFVVISFFTIVGVSGCSKSKNPTPPKENIFRVSEEAKITSLDPLNTTDVYSSMAQSLFYESLYQYHFLKRPYEIVPVLAAELPVVSKDQKTITIRLKQGVHFHDDPCFEATAGKGREMTADDVAYMFHRISAPKSLSPFYGSFENRIAGAKEFHEGKATSIAGVKVIDKYTVELHLLQVLPRFIYNFTDIKTAILPKECVEKYGDKFSIHPVGTGPFLPQYVDLGSKIVAARNPNYKHMVYPSEGNPGDKEKGLLADAGKSLPLLDKVVIEINPESQPAWLKFLAGEYERSAIPKDSYGSAMPQGKISPELEKRGIQHLKQAKGDVVAMIFNMDDSVWGKKKELRHAVALALDVPKIIEIQYSGQAIRAHSLIDPTLYGYDEKFKSRWADRDLKKARELLAKAGYPDGKGLPPLVMPTTASTTARNLDELMARQLAEVGIILKAEPMTWPEMMQRKQHRNFTVIGIGFSSNVPDVDDMTGMLHSRNIASGQNDAGYRNPEIDKLVDEIEFMTNGPARLAKIRRMQEILDDELPYIPMTHRLGNQLLQPWVKNHIYTDRVMAGPSFKYHRVETLNKQK